MTANELGQQPAYPRKRSMHIDPNTNQMIHDPPQNGMTKREVLAGMAMQGLVGLVAGRALSDCDADAIARDAIQVADAVLVALAGGAQ